MPLYLVKVRQEIEWEDFLEADNADLAEETARFEAQRSGTVVDCDAVVEEVQPVEVTD